MTARGMLLPLLALAACEQAAGEGAPTPAEHDPTIYCALGGAGNFARECTLERAEVEGAQILVVRHPDGSFRRFEIVDGALALADGAPFADIAAGEGGIDVTVGGDRYSFPADIANALRP